MQTDRKEISQVQVSQSLAGCGKSLVPSKWAGHEFARAAEALKNQLRLRLRLAWRQTHSILVQAGSSLVLLSALLLNLNVQPFDFLIQG